jgi:hypothetical protein
VAIVALAVAAAALVYALDGKIARDCNILQMAGWMVLQVLRPVVSASGASVQAYLTENAGCLPHLRQIVASIGPLFCAFAG